MCYKGLWKINNETFFRVVKEEYLKDIDYVRETHSMIAETLDRVSNSIRKLEE